jgi:hypothetical protein
MTTVTGYGAVPASPLDTTLVEGLFGERLAQNSQWQMATELAPIKNVDGHKGEYPIDLSWNGVDLSADPNSGTAVSNYATEYPAARPALGSLTYEIERYLVDSFDLSNNEAAKFQASAGFSIEDFVVDRITRKAAAMHYKKVVDTITTSGNYASGYAYDPGNLATDSTSIVAALDTMVGLLLAAQSWDYGERIIVWCSRDGVKHLQTLDEIQQSVTIGNSNDVIPTVEMLDGFFKRYLSPRAEFRVLSGKYKAANGTVTDNVSATMGFIVPPEASRKYGFATLMPSDGTGKVVDVRPKDAPELGGGGTRILADAYYQVECPSYNSGNDAAILWTTPFA